MGLIKIIHLPKQSPFRSVANQRKASILILALWSLCLLTIFSIYLGYGVRQKIVLVKRLDARDQLNSIAEAGVIRALSQLKIDTDSTYHALKDPWSNSLSFKDVKVGNGKFSVGYQFVNHQTGLLENRYGLIDEERKININKIGLKPLERLFRVVLDFDAIDAQELAASIIDWRDKDSQLSIPLGSAEDRYYKSRNYSYEAKDADFQVLEELLLVRGMNEEIFQRIKNYVTIYGEGKVNINTADKNVLLALGLSESIIDSILFFRAGDDGIVGSMDDNVFKTATNIAPKISQIARLNSAELAQVNMVADRYLNVTSSNFMIISRAKLNHGKNFAQAICVVDYLGDILYWQEL